MNQLWKVLAELSLPKRDTRSPYTAGFMNILTWAKSQEAAEEKIKTYLSSFQWTLLSVDEANVIDDDFVFDDDELQDLLEQARLNSNAILLSTLHSYKSI